MKTSENLNDPRPDDSGFTRSDLLATLAALALLTVLALPSMGRGTGKTTIAQCAANLRQYDLALQVYGSENQDKFPVSNPGGQAWPWGTAPSVVTCLTNMGVKWNNLYCPGTFPRFTEQDNFNLFNYEPGTLSVLGYASTISGTAGLLTTNVNASLTVQRVTDTTGLVYPIVPGSRALVADATMNDTGNSSVYSVMATYNWISIVGGYETDGQPHPHLSAHLNGIVPLGGNIGMLDGHVEWRNFQNMQNRSPANTIDFPYFYW